MKEINLTQGRVSLIDDEDYERVIEFSKKWQFDRYAYCTRLKKDGRKRSVRMHRLIMGFPESLEIDHINGNKLDNRKENLRICTRRQNAMNRSRKRNWVYWDKGREKWRAQVGQYQIGRYSDKEVAHQEVEKYLKESGLIDYSGR